MSTQPTAITATLAQAPVVPQPLTLWRGDAATWQSRASAALGGLAYGEGVDGAAGLHLPLLLGATGPVLDGITGAAVVRSGVTAGVRWRDDGRWTFGELDLPEGPDLTATARQAYRSVFAALREAGRSHIVRIWNYLPRINEEADTLERYRRFNIGRQDAFLEAGSDAFEGSPAACALGTAGDQLSVRFLAASHAAVPVENPRQVSAYRYSRTFGPRSPTFSRAAVVDVGGGQVALLVSGTASIVGETSQHLGDPIAQLRETCANLQAVTEAANARVRGGRFSVADLRCVVYVRHVEQAEALRAAMVEAMGEAAVAAALFVQADVCRRELLVEIEGHAVIEGTLV